MATQQQTSSFSTLTIRPKSSKPGLFLPKASKAKPSTQVSGISKIRKPDAATSELKRAMGKGCVSKASQYPATSEPTEALSRLTISPTRVGSRENTTESPQAKLEASNAWKEQVNTDENAFAFLEQHLRDQSKHSVAPISKPSPALTTFLGPRPLPIEAEARKDSLSLDAIAVKIYINVDLRLEGSTQSMGSYMVRSHESGL